MKKISRTFLVRVMSPVLRALVPLMMAKGRFRFPPFRTIRLRVVTLVASKYVT